MMCQGMVEASTYIRLDTLLLAQHLDSRMISVDYLQKSVRVRQSAILSVDEGLRDLGNFAFVLSHLLSASGLHTAAITEIPHII